MARKRPRLRPTAGYHSIGQEAAIGLLRAADRVRQHFHQVLHPFGVTLQQYNILRILRGAGPQGLPALKVAERLMEKSPGITRLLDGLERNGWIERERCSEDRRVVHNRLTSQGAALLAKLDDPIDRADDEAVAALSPDQQSDLVRLLRPLLQKSRRT